MKRILTFVVVSIVMFISFPNLYSYTKSEDNQAFKDTYFGMTSQEVNALRYSTNGFNPIKLKSDDLDKYWLEFHFQNNQLVEIEIHSNPLP